MSYGHQLASACLLGALALLVVAFRTGVDLITADLPRDTFAARWLAEVGVSRS